MHADQESGMPPEDHGRDALSAGSLLLNRYRVDTVIGGQALATVTAPELVLPDVDGNLFDLRSLLGKKVVLVAWSPY